jgi:hypothetical protein
VAKDSHILMLFEARNFYFQLRIIQDNRATNGLLLLKVLSSDECLESDDVTQVRIT